eukprot:1156056-Pelagomonas_calceolata.AAC.8
MVVLNKQEVSRTRNMSWNSLVYWWLQGQEQLHFFPAAHISAIAVRPAAGNRTHTLSSKETGSIPYN